MMPSANIQISMELWGAIICLIFFSFILIGEEKRNRRGQLLLAFLLEMFLLLTSDSAAWYYRGKLGTLGYYAVRISNYLVFVLNYFLAFTALLYLEEILKRSNYTVRKWVRHGIFVLCALGFLTVTISQFTGFLYTFDESNRYTRADGYIFIVIIAGLTTICLIACTGYYSIKSRKVQSIPLLTMFVSAFLCTIIQTLFYGVSLVNLSMCVNVVIMFFAYEKESVSISNERKTKLMEKDLLVAQQEAAYAKAETELAQKEAAYAKMETQMANLNVELSEKRTQIMLSQIQPHFMYNALSAISILCLRNPEKARATVDNFSTYLRMNLDSLRNEALVPFERELVHTKAYLAIEKVRFGDDLNVEYDIQYSDFNLPSLTIEPLVENAVRHGICGREDGGTLLIRTERIGGQVVITVKDDGVGFTPGVMPQDGRSHVGMENVGERLRAICGGDLQIESAPGQGTTATIRLTLPPDHL